MNPEKKIQEPELAPKNNKNGFNFDFPEIDKLAREEDGKQEQYTWSEQVGETHDVLMKDIEDVEDVLDKLENDKIDEDESLSDRLAEIAKARWKKEKKLNKKAKLGDQHDVAVEDLKKEYTTIAELLAQRWNRLKSLTSPETTLDDQELKDRFYEINKDKKKKGKNIEIGESEVEARRELIKELGDKITPEEIEAYSPKKEEETKKEQENAEQEKSDQQIKDKKEMDQKEIERLKRDIEAKEGQEIKLPEIKILSKTLEELENKNDKQGLKYLKEQLAGEKVYRFIKIKKPDGTFERKVQYLTLKEINKDSEGNWKCDIKVYNEDGTINIEESNKRLNYDISKIKYREWKKINKNEELPKDEDVYVTNKKNVLKLKVEKGEENDKYILKNADNKKDNGVKLSVDQIRRYEDEKGNVAYKRAIKSRTEAVVKFEKKQKAETSESKKSVNDELKKSEAELEKLEEEWKKIDMGLSLRGFGNVAKAAGGLILKVITFGRRTSETWKALSKEDEIKAGIDKLEEKIEELKSKSGAREEAKKEKEHENSIKNAQDKKELFKAIQDKGKIEWEKGVFYDSDRVINIINGYITDIRGRAKLKPDYTPSKYSGLLDKVNQLLKDKKI